ncbi:MAG: AsmA-like C-terminal region-containing protein, partial [Halioglobus sp.]
NPTPPIFSLGGEFMAVDMNQLITDLGIDSDIEGTLSVRSGLTATGLNSDELVHSLNGSFALALEDAEIKGAAYDVLATDFLGWLYSGAALEPSTYIQCTRASFKLRNGKARSRDLYMETERMLAKGKGKLNLVDNTLDITITPKSKTRLGQIPPSITLSGDIGDASVSISPVSAYANLYSEVLLIVPNFFMRLFGRELAPEKGACLAALYE